MILLDSCKIPSEPQGFVAADDRWLEVEWPGKTESFRCVSERRAAQWVEACASLSIIAWSGLGGETPKHNMGMAQKL